MKVLLTGASGFVGSALSVVLSNSGHQVIPLSFSELITGKEKGITGEFDVCVHLGGRVHVMNEWSSHPLAEFRRINVEGTLDLARKVAASGARRFVFISSIKVNGEVTSLDKPFGADDIPAPVDPYGISKMEAERGLQNVAARTDMEFVIIRPPLVYGPGVKANFQAIMRWIQRGIPLPLGTVRNKRSLVGLDNLVDLITMCVSHPAAADQTFLVSDDDDMSTSQLIQRIGKALGKPARLVPVPEEFLKLGASLLGKADFAQRLCSSLHVDISKTRRLLSWVPPVSVEEGLRRTAESWIASQRLQG